MPWSRALPAPADLHATTRMRDLELALRVDQPAAEVTPQHRAPLLYQRRARFRSPWMLASPGGTARLRRADGRVRPHVPPGHPRSRTSPAPPEVAQRLGIEAGADVLMRRLRFVADDLPVQLVRVYYQPELVAGSKLEQPVPIPDGVHGELRRLGVRVTRFVEDFMGARLPDPDEERTLQLPIGVPVTRNIRTAYAGDQPVEVMDTSSHGEVVSYRFEIEV
jgi:hypothetical protein